MKMKPKAIRAHTQLRSKGLCLWFGAGHSSERSKIAKVTANGQHSAATKSFRPQPPWMSLPEKTRPSTIWKPMICPIKANRKIHGLPAIVVGG